MEKSKVKLAEIKLVGLKTRTSNEAEFDAVRAKIANLWQQYLENNIAEKIKNRKTPYVTYSVYCDYKTDYKGEYSYFIGEEVNEFVNVPDGLEIYIIPEQDYVKFTTKVGSIPKVVIEAWQEIWKMSDQVLGGKRSYQADFEIYDQRALDQSKAVLDIYLGINKDN
jgi:predicted transcriptional regulator YdeE